MHPGFRYHVATLLAVLFSLVLGMLIGGAVFSDHTLVEEQAALISELEERFRENSTKLAALQGELDLAALAWQQLKESLAPGLLAGRHVVVVGEGARLLGPLLQLAGAQVETSPWDSLPQLNIQEDLDIVVPLGNGGLSPEERELLGAAAASGAQVSFVWESGQEPPRAGLPPSLQVDSIDTSVGELAFLLGLAARAQGHYGLQKNALGLFP
ncbi:MAG TPA: copper transporter [Limnochordia bacterium]|nr:copper transporter [Limnochordia bacterium]